MRALFALLLLLAGSQAAGGGINFVAMHEACEELKVTQIVGYTACHVDVDGAQGEHAKFKKAMAAQRLAAPKSKEYKELWDEISAILKRQNFYKSLIQKKHPASIWEAGQKLRQKVAN